MTGDAYRPRSLPCDADRHLGCAVVDCGCACHPPAAGHAPAAAAALLHHTAVDWRGRERCLPDCPATTRHAQ